MRKKSPNTKLKVLDLFSGIGGFSLGLERTGGFSTVAFCEIEPFCQKVLKKHWPNVPVYDDIRSFSGEPADVICGGYPCQPFSKAGKREGQADDRHLWPEMYRLIKSVRPRWVIAENVAGHISLGLDEVLLDLEEANYTWWVFVIPACALGADHRRDRVWIIANADGKRLQERLMHSRVQGEKGLYEYGENASLGCRGSTRPRVVRRFHGIPNRVDRIRGLGNSVYPPLVEIIGHAILNSESNSNGISKSQDKGRAESSGKGLPGGVAGAGETAC